MAIYIRQQWLDLIQQAIPYTVALWAFYFISLCLYRVKFHPLANIPGPLLARASYFYEIWYDVICGAQYSSRIIQLHKKYGLSTAYVAMYRCVLRQADDCVGTGPIVRINPDELHTNDINFIDVVYAHGHRKRDKSIPFNAGFGELVPSLSRGWLQ